MVLSDARKRGETTKPKYCTYCKGELKIMSNRSFFCGHCKVIMQIHTECTSIDSPILNNKALHKGQV